MVRAGEQNASVSILSVIEELGGAYRDSILLPRATVDELTMRVLNRKDCTAAGRDVLKQKKRNLLASAELSNDV